MSIDITRKLLELLERDIPCASAVIIRAGGSIPNEVGATLLCGAGGEIYAGTVGGGEIERRTIEQCREALAEGKHRTFDYALTDEEAGGIGMMCGGNADIFVQVHKPRPQLVLFGAGHVNIELARFAGRFDWAVTVVDDRPEWCSAENYPDARRIVAPLEEAVEQLTFSERSTYVVIATRDHDDRGLRVLVERPCAYVGMVASKRKVITLIRKLADEGLDTEGLLSKLRSPVGLALGGRGPADVALSIIAELQAIRHGMRGEAMTLPEERLRKELAKRQG